MQSTINTALAQAKASGEFDGADGVPGKDGANGQPGAPGSPGKDGVTPTIGDNGNWYIGDTDTGKPSRGENGDTGATPNIQIGTVETLSAGSPATASITGTAENPLLNLGIPKGDTGDTVQSGAGETYELLYDITLTEAVDSFEQTITPCKKARMLIFPNAMEDISGWKRVTINGIVYPAMSVKMGTIQAFMLDVDTENQPYFRSITGVYQHLWVNGAYGNLSIGFGLKENPTEITSLGCSTAEMLNEGAVIKIWGVKS